MGIATGLTAERMQEIIDQQVVSATVDPSGSLIFQREDGSTFDGGIVKGPKGDTAPLATTEAPGSVEIATNPEIDSGVDTGRVISAAGLRYFAGNSTQYALLDPSYRGPGPARVSFLPGGSLGPTYYQWVGRYIPTGSRVVTMTRRGSGWVIQGQTEEENYGGKLNLEPLLRNGWRAYNLSTGTGTDRWAWPRAMRTPAGIVMLSGLIARGTVTTGTTLLTLPENYRPDTEMIFAVNVGDNPRSIEIMPDGRVLTRTGWPTDTHVSLDGIAYPAAGVASWTEVGAAGSGSAYQSGWSAHSAVANFGRPRFWKDGYGFVWLAGLVQGSIANATDNQIMFTLPTTHQSYRQTHLSLTNGDTFGFLGSNHTNGPPVAGGGIHWKVAPGNNSATWTSLSGLCLVSEDARESNPWIVPTDFNTGWGNYSASYTDFAYLRRGDGMAMTRGLVKGGTAPPAIMSTVPRELPPHGEIILHAASSQSFARLDIRGGNFNADNRGQVYLQSGSSGWFSMDNKMWMPGE